MTSIKKDSSAQDFLKDVVKITRTWELPAILKEISGIDYIDSSHIVCIQDEVGSIYIYNITTNTLEAEIPFGPPGDYEAVSVIKDIVYVACADGRLYEISNYNSAKPTVKEYGTHLTVKQNIEGLSYDPKSKLLLVAIKGKEDDNPVFKGIYSFDPSTKKMPVKPVLQIDLQDPVFVKNWGKKLQSVIQPSEIAINPLTGDIYITDAVRPQLLIMDRSGNIKGLYPLNKTDFPQPEGITFSPAGECYISNEGNKQQPATLLLVSLKLTPQ
ncbi:MAG: SdiA-regulated domain-containing protein [Chitinophagaceae bacterium]|nr:SdiA-regulated domain-containing protein [Chitinophagaceae bacterium]